MVRRYVQKTRADKTRETRERILELSRKYLPEADELRIEEIAKLAKVSIQTLYSHFGSKAGLLGELFEAEMGAAALEAGFARVWSSRHGEDALRAMLDATLTFWHHAWPMIAFALRVRRTDPELGARIDAFDDRRLDALLVICRRLAEEDRLPKGVAPGRAARLAFGLSTPYVYEALVVQNHLPSAVAREHVIAAVIGIVVDPDSRAAPSERVDWARLGRPQGAGRARP